MSNNQKFDWSMFSDPESCVDLYGHMVRWGLADDDEADSTLFKAVALTDTFPLTANQLMAIDGGSTGEESGNNMRSAFRARIIGDNSPHSFIADPCDPAVAGDLDFVYKNITMHTLFIGQSSTFDVPVTRGDIVLVRLNKTGHSYNLEYGAFEELLAVEDPSGIQGENCSALIDLFGEIEHKPFPDGPGFVGGEGTGTPATWVDTGEAEGHWNEPKQCGSQTVPTYFRFSKSLAALDPNVRGRFQKFFQLAAAKGVTARITSVRRSPKHQWVLMKWPSCYGAMTPEAPCYSQHQYGFAVDVVFTYNGRKCLNANGCIPNVLMPIVRQNNLKIKQIGDQDYVHWQSTDENDIAVYLERRKKCIQYYYIDNEYTAQYGSKSGAKGKRFADSRKWPHDFTDNLEVIGVSSTETAVADSTPSGPTDEPAGGGEWEIGVNWVWVDDSGNDTTTKSDGRIRSATKTIKKI